MNLREGISAKRKEILLQHFREFSAKNFQHFFLVKSKLSTCQQLNSAKPRIFHEFFPLNFFDNFSRQIKVVKDLKIRFEKILGFLLIY